MQTLTTAELLEVRLAYPFLDDIQAFNFVNDGIDKLILKFNGLGKLVEKQDLGRALIDAYMSRMRHVGALNNPI